MGDRIRTLEEILELLREAAQMQSYFEIGPEEAKLLWDEFVRRDPQRSAPRRGGEPR